MKNYKLNYLKLIICIIIPTFFFVLFSNNSVKKNLKLENITSYFSSKINSFFDFQFNHIIINDLKYIKKSEIEDILKSHYNKNIFSFNLNKLRKKIKVLELVESIYVERVIPNTIKIIIKEKKPIGIIQHGNIYKLITSDGSIISNHPIHEFNYLPIFSGKNVEKHAKNILFLLNQTNFKEDIWSINLINERRWDLNLKTGVKILLPEKNIVRALNLIRDIHFNFQILDGNFIKIDLRNKKQIFLKPLIKSLDRVEKK